MKNPTPFVPANISLNAITSSATARLILSPAKICGLAAGRMIFTIL